MLITLMTDFGLADTYVGQMKGVIQTIAPQTDVIDLTHSVPPHDILAGALMLDAAIDSFPPDTIHVGVVDPGVGSSRAAIAVEAQNCIFIGPDNGLFSVALSRRPMMRAVRLENWRYFRHPVSHTFHGRDIFAPVAAHLAQGVPLAEMGPAMTRIVTLDIARPQRLEDDSLKLTVLRIDGFGNALTNFTRRDYEPYMADQPDSQALITLGPDRRINGIQHTYADVEPGQPVAYFGSSDRLEIAIRNASAASEYGIKPGQTFIFRRK
jgi:S-adenosylmethionine hydrolase